jgi:hypothetical protein
MDDLAEAFVKIVWRAAPWISHGYYLTRAPRIVIIVPPPPNSVPFKVLDCSFVLLRRASCLERA